MGINKEWHEKNRMPKCPTKNQRAVWHIEHTKACDCRKPTDNIQKLIDDYKSNEGKK